jgi:hypothetical protein
MSKNFTGTIYITKGTVLYSISYDQNMWPKEKFMGVQVKYHASKTNLMWPKQNSSDQPKYHVIKPNQWSKYFLALPNPILYETEQSPLCSMAGRYDNPIPTRFLAPIDCLKIPAQISCYKAFYYGIYKKPRDQTYIFQNQEFFCCILSIYIIILSTWSAFAYLYLSLF